MLSYLERSTLSSLTTSRVRSRLGLEIHIRQSWRCYSAGKGEDNEENHILLHQHEQDHSISILTLNRPRRANAMGSMMLQQLQDTLEYLSQDLTTRCVILTSSSSKVFSAGADLKERSKMSQDEAVEFVSNLRMTMDRLATLPVPTVASIEGVAVGGGLEIAMAADIRVAGVTATFGLPETSLAIIPGAGGTQRLPRLIGIARAKELIFTGRRIDATTALHYGLVQHVEEDAATKAISIASEIAKNGPLGIRASKEAIDKGMEAPSMIEALEIEQRCYQKVMPTHDRLEGLNAFREGRQPIYNGD